MSWPTAYNTSFRGLHGFAAAPNTFNRRRPSPPAIRIAPGPRSDRQVVVSPDGTNWVIHPDTTMQELPPSILRAVAPHIHAAHRRADELAALPTPSPVEDHASAYTDHLSPPPTSEHPSAEWAGEVLMSLAHAKSPAKPEAMAYGFSPRTIQVYSMKVDRLLKLTPKARYMGRERTARRQERLSTSPKRDIRPHLARKRSREDDDEACTHRRKRRVWEDGYVSNPISISNDSVPHTAEYKAFKDAYAGLSHPPVAPTPLPSIKPILALANKRAEVLRWTDHCHAPPSIPLWEMNGSVNPPPVRSLEETSTHVDHSLVHFLEGIWDQAEEEYVCQFEARRDAEVAWDDYRKMLSRDKGLVHYADSPIMRAAIKYGRALGRLEQAQFNAQAMYDTYLAAGGR